MDAQVLLLALSLSERLSDAERAIAGQKDPRSVSSELARPLSVAHAFLPISISSAQYYMAADEELRNALHGTATDIGARIGCMLELTQRGDPAIPGFVARELELQVGGSADAAWRDGLLVALERLPRLDAELRTRFTEVLLRLARILRTGRGRATEWPLWAALRSYARFAEAGGAGSLMDFLHDEDVPLTQQAALQALTALFARSPDRKMRVMTSLTERVAAIGLSSLADGGPETAEDASLAINAVRAAVVLGAMQAGHLVSALIDARKPYLLRLCIGPLREVAESPPWRVSESEVAVGLRAHLARLAEALLHPFPSPSGQGG